MYLRLPRNNRQCALGQPPSKQFTTTPSDDVPFRNDARITAFDTDKQVTCICNRSVASARVVQHDFDGSDSTCCCTTLILVVHLTVSPSPVRGVSTNVVRRPHHIRRLLRVAVYFPRPRTAAVYRLSWRLPPSYRDIQRIASLITASAPLSPHLSRHN